MEERLYDSVYLTAHELLVLATGAGMEQMEGLLKKPVEEVPEEALRKSFFSLCSRGLMTVREEEGQAFFQVSETVAEIFRAIRDAEETKLIFDEGEESPKMLCYLGDTCVALQVSETDENAVRLFAMEREAFTEWLELGRSVTSTSKVGVLV